LIINILVLFLQANDHKKLTCDCWLLHSVTGFIFHRTFQNMNFMKNLKFFALMRTLEKEEVSHFQKYLKQLHGGEDIALQVFAYARKYYTHKKHEKKLDIAYAYQKIFGEEITENTRKKMLNTLSDLYLWLKDFLLSEKMRQDAFERQVPSGSASLQERPGLAAPNSPRLSTRVLTTETSNRLSH
jgi:hypothetical protein